MFQIPGRWLACATSALLLVAGCNVTKTAVPPVGKLNSAPEHAPRIPEPDPAAAEVPQGYQVEVVLKGLIYPTSVEFDDAGDMYVAEAGYVYGDPAAPARVLRVGREGNISVAADQLSGPVNDLLWHDGRLYVSHRGKVSVLGGGGGSVRDIVTGLPSNGDHQNNQLAVGQGGKIYIGQGTATNSGVVGIDNFMLGWLRMYPDFHDAPAKDIRLTGESFLTVNPFMLVSNKPGMMAHTSPLRRFSQTGDVAKGAAKPNGSILRFNSDGSGLEVYAWGLRNPFGLTWGPDGKLYAAENGFDQRGSRPIGNAPDNIWHIEQGAWYGWPDFASGIPVTDSRFRPSYGPEPEFVMKEHPPVGKPVATRPPHVGVTKIAFPTGDGFGGKNSLFVGEFGDLSPMTARLDEHRGFQVTRLDLASGKAEPFFRAKPGALGPKGMEYVATAGPKHPLDVVFSRDGRAMYVVDLGAYAMIEAGTPVPMPFPGTGVVWRITRTGTTVDSPPANISVGPGGNSGAAATRPRE